MKNIIKCIGEALGFLLVVYIMYFTFCVLCISDGTQPGTLFYDLQMDHVLRGLGRAAHYVYHLFK